MKLKIGIPAILIDEVLYTIEVLFREFLGIPYETIIQKDLKEIRIAGGNRRLDIENHFFLKAANGWLDESSLPAPPLPAWNVADDLPHAKVVARSIPVLFGKPFKNGSFISIDENKISLKLDVIGSAFFMLSRYEEAVLNTVADPHGRFPVRASILHHHDLRMRPVINEYIEILWLCMKHLWPQLERKKRQFRTLVSHDVDYPFFYFYMNFVRLFKYAASDLLIHGALQRAAARCKKWHRTRRGQLGEDPYNSFDLLMTIDENYNLHSTFYFLAAHPAGVRDCRYHIDDPVITGLLRSIYDRGHEIGLHASYNSYLDCDQTSLEFNKLRQTCKNEGIKQEAWGSRQHYLRWKTPATILNLEKAGLSYDSSLGFAENPGFRCGICYEYPAYDLLRRRPLKIRERPLIVMESSIIDKHYMNLGSGEKAYSLMAQLKDICRLYNGDFTLLWHNTHLVEQSQIELYRAVLEA